jgi:hypothetical protein
MHFVAPRSSARRSQLRYGSTFRAASLGASGRPKNERVRVSFLWAPARQKAHELDRAFS